MSFPGKSFLSRTLSMGTAARSSSMGNASDAHQVGHEGFDPRSSHHLNAVSPELSVDSGQHGDRMLNGNGYGGQKLHAFSKLKLGVDWRQVLTHLQREKKRAIARKEEQYIHRSLFCLTSSSMVRENLIKLVEWDTFNNAILGLILANCIFLVLDDPVCKCDKDQCTEQENYIRELYVSHDCGYWPERREVLQNSELVFTILFTLEMVIKIVARGFILHKHAYLRDGWNWLDFIVVVCSLISQFDLIENVQVLRTVRVLRPLRTMTKIKGMRPLINTLLKSIKALGNVGMLLMFFLIVYGILGIELLSSGMRGRCFVDPTPDVNNFTEAALSSLLSQQVPFLAAPSYSVGSWNPGIEICAGSDSCSPYFIDGKEYQTICKKMLWCQDGWCSGSGGWNPNPYDMGGGYISYDNILSAFLTIIQAMTMEAWVDVMYNYQDGWNKWGARLFHSSWVLIGTFFVIQLALAVLSDSFVTAQDEERTEKEREALHNQAILKPEEVLKPQVGRGRLKAAASNMRLVASFMSGIRKPAVQSTDSMSEDMAMTTFNGENGTDSARASSRNPVWTLLTHPKVAEAHDWTRTRARVVVQSQTFQNFILLAIMMNTALMIIYRHDQALFEESICQRRCDLDPRLPSDARDSCSGPLFNNTFDSDGQGGGYRPVQKSFCFLEDDAKHLPGNSTCSQITNETLCLQATPSNGQECVWIDDKCKLGLYSPISFAEEAQLVTGGKGRLSLRQICGDDLSNSECPSFSEKTNTDLDTINTVLTVIFICEMFFKMLGLGLLGYFDDSFNQFDFLIVMISIIELVIQAASNSNSGSTISALRGMRLFRLFKLARAWKSMRKILHTLGLALSSLGPLTIVWIMFMYIFALLAQQFFGGKFRTVKADNPRSNFDSFIPTNVGHGAFMVVFQIISTENWNTIMYNCMTALNTASPWASILSVVIVMFGNYIIMNLFISILLQGFGDDEEDEDESEEEDDKPKIGPAQRLANRFRTLLGRRAPVAPAPEPVPSLAPTASSGRLAAQALAKKVQDQEKNRRQSGVTMTDDGSEASQEYDVDVTIEGTTRVVRLPDHNSLYFLSKHSRFRQWVAYVVHHPVFDNLILLCIFVTSVSLLLERPDDGIVSEACPRAPERLDCSGLPPGQIDEINCPREVSHEMFGQVFDACGSGTSRVPPCCTVAARVAVFRDMDIVFTIIFLIEMCLKIISDGLFFHHHAYLRNGWNILDCFIVIISMFSAFGDGEQFKSLKALRSFRALRPLRVIKRHPSLRIAVVCLLSSIPSMWNVIVVVFVWFSMYAMLGVQLFKGSLYRCYDPQNQMFYGSSFFPTNTFTYTATLPLSGPDAVPTIIECVSAGSTENGERGGLGVWTDRDYTFNTYQEALLTLFEMSTTEGWVDVMAAVSDNVGVGVTPIPNYNALLPSLYCALHIILGAFVLLNLIVGSVISNYTRIKSKNDGIAPFMTPEQQEWKEIQRMVFQLKPQRRRDGPQNPFRMRCFLIANHPWFEYGITFVILANVVTMVVKTHDQDPCVTAALFFINLVFTITFSIEAIIKLIGLGWWWYIKDTWNKFDLLIVLLSIATTVLDSLSGEYDCTSEASNSFKLPALQVFRAFRIARVFRLVRRLKGLRQMIETLIISLPSLGNIGALLVLMTAIFAVLGVTFFYNVNLNQDLYGRMDESANYVWLDNAIWLLHRQTTGEAWNGIMYYCSNDDKYQACNKCYGAYLSEGVGGSFIGIGFHVLWQLFGTYVMMQLFTAVILENFHELQREDVSAVPIDKLNEFVEAWTTLDPDASGSITINQIPDLILSLSPPLGLKNKHCSNAVLMQVMKDLQIPIKKQKVYYIETILACVKRVLASDLDDEDLDIDYEASMGKGGFPPSSDDEEEEKDASLTMSKDDSTAGVRVMNNGRIATVAEDFAARRVQRAYKEWKERRLQVKKAVSVTFEIPVNGNARGIISW